MLLACPPHPRRRLVVLALPIVAALGLNESALASAPPTTPPVAVDPPPAGYVRLVDDTLFLTVVVPETWSTVDTAPSTSQDGTVVPDILASTVGIEEFDTTFTSGVHYFAIPYEADPAAFIAATGLNSGCQSIEVQPYQGPVFTGSVQVGTNCGEDGGTWNMVVASPADLSFTAVVQLQMSSSAEQEAFDVVLDTFTYSADPNLPPGVIVSSSVPVVSVPG